MNSTFHFEEFEGNLSLCYLYALFNKEIDNRCFDFDYQRQFFAYTFFYSEQSMASETKEFENIYWFYENIEEVSKIKRKKQYSSMTKERT